jgi:hypothetical protein
MSAKLTNRVKKKRIIFYFHLFKLFYLKMMDHVMTCLEEISGSGGSNSLRDK